MYHWVMRITVLAALSLVAFPEPVTTAIGIGILAGVGFVSRKRYGRVLKRFEAMLREFLKCTRHLEYTMPEKTVYHSLRPSLFEQRHMLGDWQKTSSQSPFQRSVKRNEALLSDIVVRHTLHSRFPEPRKSAVRYGLWEYSTKAGGSQFTGKSSTLFPT